MNAFLSIIRNKNIVLTMLIVVIFSITGYKENSNKTASDANYG